MLYISYTALNGLPWQDDHDVTVAVPDAGKLIKNTEVRVGGARVGQVLAIEAVPRRGNVPPHAVLEVQLEATSARCRSTRSAEVRLGSVLGGKYLELMPGKARRTIPVGRDAAAGQPATTVDIEEASGLRPGGPRRAPARHRARFGDAVAGRGGDLNETIEQTAAAMLPGLQRVLTNARRATDRPARAFVRGAAAATTALEPVAAELGPFVRDAATTLGALDAAGASLGREHRGAAAGRPRHGERTLRRLRPVLDDAVAVSRDLRPAAAVLAPGARGLDVAWRPPRSARPASSGAWRGRWTGSCEASDAFAATRRAAGRCGCWARGPRDVRRLGRSSGSARC